MKRYDPMLAENFERDLSTATRGKWFAEVKYDGSRLLSYWKEGEVDLITRRGKNRTDNLPEIVEELQSLEEGIVLDGELTFVDSEGVSQFLPLHTGRERVREKGLEVRYFVFDILERHGEDLTEVELDKRKKILEQVLPEDTEHIKVAPYTDSGYEELYQKTLEKGQEGIMLKKTDSWYFPGSRSSVWRKVKSFKERDAVVVGYTEGEGSRSSTFGALVLSDGEKYIGKVGSGFSQEDLENITSMFERIEQRQFRIEDEFYPVEPFVVEVKYQEASDDGKLRSPVFLRIRQDKPISEVQTI